MSNLKISLINNIRTPHNSPRKYTLAIVDSGTGEKREKDTEKGGPEYP